jgi:hypothetical protein
VPYAILVTYGATISSPEFTPVTGNVSWLHFRTFFDTYETQRDGKLVTGYDTNGNALFMFEHPWQHGLGLTEITLYTDPGTTVVNQTFALNYGLINTVDIRYENNGTNLTKVQMYVNGGLAGEVTEASSVSFGQLAYFTLGTPWVDSPGTMRVSEMIVADGDTRNARLNLLRPTAVGGETGAWIGAALDLADDDPTTGMTSITAAQRQTFALSAYTGASNISAVVVATQSMAGANAPQNMRHTLRLSTVNYDGPSDIPLGDALAYHVTDWQSNPGASAPWLSSVLGAMEMGFISAT